MSPCSEPRDSRGKAPGFTLMEVLVAFTILSITLVTLYQAFSANLLIHTSTRSLWKAMVYVDNELQRWERMGPPPLHVDQGEFPEDHAMAGYSWLREVSDEAPLPGVIVRRVRLRLNWQEGERSRRYASEVYVARETL